MGRGRGNNVDAALQHGRMRFCVTLLYLGIDAAFLFVIDICFRDCIWNTFVKFIVLHNVPLHVYINIPRK